MINIIVGGIGAAIAALLFANKDEDEAEMPILKQEDVPLLDEGDIKPKLNKNDKELIAKGDLFIIELQKKIEAHVPDHLQFWLTVGSDDKISLSWQDKGNQNCSRVGRITGSDLTEVLKTLQQVDWDEEEIIAEKCSDKLKEFCRNFEELKAQNTE